MLSRVGLEVMNSTNQDLSWKSVTKGRRSRTARSLNIIAKAGNSVSPKRAGDFSGSDSDKFGEVIPGQESFVKSENVPLKKRRHLLQSPSPHPWASSLHKQDSAPSRTHSSSPLLDDCIQLKYPSCSSGDFSGIELLAAAASLDDADKRDTLPADPSVQKNSDASCFAALSKQCLKKNESVDSFSNINIPGGNVEFQENSTAPQSLSVSPEDGTVPKVDRKHWDLNTSMDAWGEPYDDSIAGETLKNVNGAWRTEEMEKHFVDHVPSNLTAITDEKPSLKVEQDKSTSLAEDGMCSEPPHFKENLLDPPTSIYDLTVRDTSNTACEKDPDDKNSIKALNCDADLKRLNQVASLDASNGRSSFSMICSRSGMLKSEEENNGISCNIGMIKDGDCSSNMSECERTAALNGSYTRTDEVDAQNRGASEFSSDAKPEDIEVSHKTSSPGIFSIDAQPVAITDSNTKIDGAFLSKSTTAECKQYLELAVLGTNDDEDCILLKEDSNRTILVDTCKNLSAGAQCDEPTSVGRIGLALDGQCNPGVSQDNHVDIVNGDDLTGFQEGYDSPYEDGELRGSFLYSWEDNEMENECVDYESDGRNGDGTDAAEYLCTETAEGGSDGSNGSQRSSSLKISAEGKTKSATVKAFKKHVVKTGSDNKEITGKGSNGGSGSTVEQCEDLPVDGNDGVKRLELLDHKNAVDIGAMTDIGEYALKAVKGKLLSRIEGRSSADAPEGKDLFFRPRRFAGSYPRPERDISPDRYGCRYRSAAPGENNGAHQWASLGFRKHYTTSYQGGQGRNNTRPRSKTGESANKIDGLDYHDPRQTNYLSKGLHRPLMRRSPVERDEYFGVGRRIPLTREMGHYRSRGHFSQHPVRDFVENFEPLPVNAGASVRMRRYISRRERSFSPGSGRQMHMTFPRRRSRSRSKTRSPPRAWQNSQRERILGGRRLSNSRSPDFRSDERMERRRMPFPKPACASDYGEGCISPSRGRFSPQQNCRWVEDGNFTVRRRRSPGRGFKRGQRFDVGSSGRLKPDEYFRPVIRPGRFSLMSSNGGRECKLDSNYDDRRREDGGHRVVDEGGNMRRFQQNTGGDDFDTKNMNSEEEGMRVGEAAKDNA